MGKGGVGGGGGVDSSEVFVIPYLILGLTAIKMFNLGIEALRIQTRREGKKK